MLSLLCGAVLCFIGVPVQCASNFGYEDMPDILSPDRWAKEYKECAGKYQSPIDIEESLVTRVSLPPLHFSGTSDLPYTSTLTNNGHTVMLQINGTEPITVSGGPLKETYTFEQLHFHWGADDSSGSEDTINNHSFPMELHMVFFKSAYDTFTSALHHKDGLTVVSLFFEISNRDNKAYSELVDSLKSIIRPSSQVELPYLLPLDFFLPKNKQNYFTYNGSLTTPPCLEVVTWIQFKHPVLLSHNQLDSFRKLQSDTGYLTHNARPLQPLHGRQVLYNTADLKSGAPQYYPQVTLLLLSAVLLLKCTS